MFSALANLTNIIYDIDPTRQVPKVRKYVESQAYMSVLEDFGKVLHRQLDAEKDGNRIQAIFDRFSVESSSSLKCWDEESFRRYVRSTIPESSISDPAIQLLWRSFSYYAYHPIPRHCTEIDFDAFKRAVMLLAFQCDDLIGTQEREGSFCEYFWRDGDSLFRIARIERLFRSIGMPASKVVELEGPQTEALTTDAIDILAMVGPDFIGSGPRPDQYRSFAQKLFDGVIMKTEVMRDDVFLLMDLLLRLRVRNEKWGSHRMFNHGDFAEASPSSAALTNNLVDTLAGEKSCEPFTPATFHKVLDLMPNFHLRFYQLWAVIFQPQIGEAQEDGSDALYKTSILGALHLFIPQIKLENRYTRFVSAKIEEVAIKPKVLAAESLSISELALGLSNSSSGHIVLFTGTHVSNDEEASVGVYFPGPMYHIEDDSQVARKRGGKGGTGEEYPPYLLFQLTPRYRLFRGSSTTDLRRLIHPKDPTILLETIDTTNHELTDITYRIGKPDIGREKNAHLEVDPVVNTVRLVGLSSGDGMWFGEDPERGQSWEFMIRNCRIDILVVTGGLLRGVEPAASGMKANWDNNEAHTSVHAKAEDPSGRVVGEDVLKKIDGFGSRGERITRKDVERQG